MTIRYRNRPVFRTAVAGVVAASALGLAGCGDTAGEETGASVEEVQEEVGDEAVGDAAAGDEAADAGATGEEAVDPDTPFDGPYDAAFAEDAQSYVGQEVTLSADVNEVISPNAFVIAGTDDTTVDPLLVVSATEVTDLEQDLTVAVTGTVQRAFVLTDVESELGVDFDDAMFSDWEGQPYVVANSVDTSVASDQ